MRHLRLKSPGFAAPVGVLAVLLAVFLIPRSAAAWGEVSHRMATMLATTLLTAESQAQVVAFLDSGFTLTDDST